MKKSVTPAVTPQEVRQIAQELCDIAGYGLQSGIHPGPKADEAANYILNKLMESGLDARLEPVVIRDPWPESWSLTVDDKGKPRDIYCIPYGWTVGTPRSRH